MAPTRRRVLHALAVSIPTGLAGCNALTPTSDPESTEYTLTTHRIEALLTDHVLFEPNRSDLFGDPQRAALEAIFTEGAATTSGYAPLPDDAYVQRDGRYYELERAVTGRRTVERTVVRGRAVPESEPSADAVPLDSLPRPSARVVKILHHAIQTGSVPDAPNAQRDRSYVLRRPAELDDPIAGELDGRVVRMNPDGPWAVRLSITTEQVSEAVYTMTARPVADSAAGFREIARADRVDTYLPDYSLSSGAQETLEQALGRGEYRETTPLSEAFSELLGTLAIDDDSENGLLLETNSELYSYSLYVNRTDE